MKLTIPQSARESPVTVRARAALKEWAVTVEALVQGRQILLLRKGGLLDEDGTFSLEQSRFFFLPTWLHQEPGLLKTEHRDLLALTPPPTRDKRRSADLRVFAQVARVWALEGAHEAALRGADHIWSDGYLDLRLGYRPEAPLLAVALRVWELQAPVHVALRDEDMGCRSWVEWGEPVEALATPVLSETEFQFRLDQIRWEGLDLPRILRGNQ